ncbi:Chaperone protein HtpG [uncultured Candidatus Thioglobus sp.]|nr:Chaperone protein HtpG [uncultured Candidatus Thioglobus sp.]
MRNKKDIKKEEYHEFYKNIAHDFEDPLTYSHNRVEGKLDYTNLLYIPARAPFDMWDRQNRHGLKLYVHRIFIMDDAEHLLPAYLRFVRGIIDSNDLPLNVSREILQKNKMIDSIRAGITKKVLDTLTKMAQEQKEKYSIFWKEFGRVLKEGIIETSNKKEVLANLFRFTSSHTDQEEQNVTLEDYIARMIKDQEKIYYMTADSFVSAKNSPHLEIFRENSIEVLLLSDPIDEWLVSHLSEFKEHKLQSVTKGELDLGKLIKDKKPKQKDDTSAIKLIERMQTVLAEKVKSVRTTDRLRQSPVCLVADEHGMELNLEKILKASGQDLQSNQNKFILEINIKHPLLLKLNDSTDQQMNDWAHILFDQAVLSAGGQLEDPVNFVRRLNDILLGMDGTAIATKKVSSTSKKKVSKKKVSKKKVKE